MSAGGAGLQNLLTCLVNIGPDISIKSIYVARPGKEESLIFSLL